VHPQTAKPMPSHGDQKIAKNAEKYRVAGPVRLSIRHTCLRRVKSVILDVPVQLLESYSLPDGRTVTDQVPGVMSYANTDSMTRPSFTVARSGRPWW